MSLSSIWTRLAREMNLLLRALGVGGRIDYVGGAEALPPPLTQEEEGLLLNRLRRGDVDVRSTLIERNLRLVVYIAKKFENTGIPVDDLVSIGSVGLIKAVSTFDIEKTSNWQLTRQNASKTKYSCTSGEP